MEGRPIGGRAGSLWERATTALQAEESASIERDRSFLHAKREADFQYLLMALESFEIKPGDAIWNDVPGEDPTVMVDGLTFMVHYEPMYGRKGMHLRGLRCEACKTMTHSHTETLVELGLALRQIEAGDLFLHSCHAPAVKSPEPMHGLDRPTAYPLDELGGYMTEPEVALVKALREFFQHGLLPGNR